MMFLDCIITLNQATHSAAGFEKIMTQDCIYPATTFKRMPVLMFHFQYVRLVQKQ